MPPKRPLLLAFAAIVACALLLVAHRRAERIQPALATLAAEAAGSFTEGSGWYPGEPFARAAPNLRAWGSWSGADTNTGTLTIGPLPAPRVLRLGLGGYPANPGNSLHVELVGTTERRAIEFHPVGERWHICDFELPRAWEGRPIRVVAIDNATGLGGWLAITEPIRGGRSDGHNALLETATAAALNALLLGLLYLAATRILFSTTLPLHWQPLAAGALVAAAGYLVYWAYFAHPWLGFATTAALFAAALLRLVLPPRLSHAPSLPPSELRPVLVLLLTIGSFHLAVLHLFPTEHDFYTLTANRFRDALPGDNALSHMYAERLFAGEPPKNVIDEWQSSDRPPLQIGWQLLTWPASKLLGLDRKTFSGTAAVWFQLLWIPGVYGLLRTFRVSPRRAAGWIAACALSGFFIQNTTFTWPKLSAGAFTLAAFALLFLPRPADASATPRPARARACDDPRCWAAAFAALGWLSHGGVAFSFLPLLPVLAWRVFREGLRPWLPAAAVFAALALPWIAYQKLYDPPGNLLLKFHFAGQLKQDPRGVGETIASAYARLGWREALHNKVTNFHAQVFGNWSHLLDVSVATKVERRNHEFFHLGRGLTWWPILALVAIALTNRRVFADARALAVTAAWLLATVVVWCLLMFGAYTASIHHGSYAVPLALFVVCSVLLDRCGRSWLPVLVALQTVTFATTWAVANPAIGGLPIGLPFVLLTGALLLGVILWSVRSAPAGAETATAAATTPAPSIPVARPARALTLTGRQWALVFAVGFVAFFLRKPHALHTPQLWAEDGSVFLMQNDLHGPPALAFPYMGYLHTLPRLIAFVTSHLSDPQWWPHIYNATAFAIWLLVAARFFTARFAHLPRRGWLAFALIAAPHTGEVFFNITNLQWLTAFVLIQQAIVAPPLTRTQRVTDLAILALVGLTGPFAIAFTPLFVLRWLLEVRAAGGGFFTRALFGRDRRDTLAALAVVASCAAIQAWFVVRTGPHFDYQATPFQLSPTLVITARRLLAWPILGRDLALNLSPTLIGVFGCAVLAALVALGLRRAPERPLRLQLLAALGLVAFAGIYRTRPDTWAADTLDFGDRYFYIPRVLVVWLLLWEIDARSRVLSGLARIACVLIALFHLSEYTQPAPPDYRWREHVTPIRQGVRADIPTLPEGWTLEYHGRPKR